MRKFFCFAAFVSMISALTGCPEASVSPALKSGDTLTQTVTPTFITTPGYYDAIQEIEISGPSIAADVYYIMYDTGGIYGEEELALPADGITYEFLESSDFSLYTAPFTVSEQKRIGICAIEEGKLGSDIVHGQFLVRVEDSVDFISITGVTGICLDVWYNGIQIVDVDNRLFIYVENIDFSLSDAFEIETANQYYIASETELIAGDYTVYVFIDADDDGYLTANDPYEFFLDSAYMPEGNATVSVLDDQFTVVTINFDDVNILPAM